MITADGVTLRTATEADVPALALIAMSGWPWKRFDATLKKSELLFKKRVAACAYAAHFLSGENAIGEQDGFTHLLVAEKDGEVAGYFHWQVTNNAACVLKLLVDPAKQGQGIYSRMIEAGEYFMFDHLQGIDTCVFEVHADAAAIQQHITDRGYDVYRTSPSGKKFAGYTKAHFNSQLKFLRAYNPQPSSI